MERIEDHGCFGGRQQVWEHHADTLSCKMKFGVYLPPQADERECPVLYFLSGLTCSEQNFITKAGAQQYAAEHGIILVAPDTSPRGDHVADADGWDLGKGAGYYINATRDPWASNYQMHDYVVLELPSLVDKHFPTNDARGIAGHSMGGHGALVLALRNPGVYRSVSAISPIVAPSRVPWGERAFTEMLGEDRGAWKHWDACELVGSNLKERLPLLVDQGNADDFLEEQLKPAFLAEACIEADHPLDLRRHDGYDHGYYFIATVIGDHVAHHAQMLRA